MQYDFNYKFEEISGHEKETIGVISSYLANVLSNITSKFEKPDDVIKIWKWAKSLIDTGIIDIDDSDRQFLVDIINNLDASISFKAQLLLRLY